MPSTECHGCGVVSQQVMLADPTYLGENNIDFATLDIWTAPFGCANCREINIGTLMTHRTRSSGRPDEAARRLMRDQDAGLDWKPSRLNAPDYEHTPETIASAAVEAHQCHSIKAYRAAAILARAVIEATAKDHGITEGGIKGKIKAMEEKGLLRPLVTRQAHMIRSFGNDMAHGDFGTTISETESAYVLTLMGEVLNEVYEGPGAFKAFEEQHPDKVE